MGAYSGLATNSARPIRGHPNVKVSLTLDRISSQFCFVQKLYLVHLLVMFSYDVEQTRHVLSTNFCFFLGFKNCCLPNTSKKKKKFLLKLFLQNLEVGGLFDYQ